MEEKKVDDFVSLWKKKKPESKPIAVVGEPNYKTPDIDVKSNELLKENEALKEKIKENIDLMGKTETYIKQLLAEKQQLAADRNQHEMLVEKINSLQNELATKEGKLKTTEMELSELNSKIAIEKMEAEKNAGKPSTENMGSSTALIEQLQSDLSKKKFQISDLQARLADYETKIDELTKSNEELNKLAGQAEKNTVTQSSEKIGKKTESATSAGKALELLCQDLQSELNKNKRLLTQVREENAKLKGSKDGAVEISEDSKDIKALKKENESLKKEISKLEKSKDTKGMDASNVNDLENTIKDLQNKLSEKDQQISELNVSKEKVISPGKAPQAGSAKGPMSELVDDLQKQINKLKVSLKEKDKMIDEFKKNK